MSIEVRDDSVIDQGEVVYPDYPGEPTYIYFPQDYTDYCPF